MHWPVPREVIQKRIPEDLVVDTHEGQAWIGLVPFAMEGIRHPSIPAIPGLRAMLELNVRTYVHFRGEPGVWFFSLDASHRPMVEGARRLYHLPYFKARMDCRRQGPQITYASRRTHGGAPAAEMTAEWEVAEERPESDPRSLNFFLTERYCLYTAHRRRLFQGRIHHPPWPLRQARLINLRSNLVESHGIALPDSQPLLHHADILHVEIFALKAVARLRDKRRWRVGQMQK